MESYQMELLKTLSAKDSIRECLMTYARGIDRIDESLIRSVYWPEATDTHGNFTGSREEFIEWVIPLLLKMDQTSHMFGNISISIRQHIADVESYFLAYHRLEDERGRLCDAILGGRYLDRMESRDGVWKILQRNVVADWGRNFGDSEDWDREFLGFNLKSNRMNNDLSYKIFQFG